MHEVKGSIVKLVLWFWGNGEDKGKDQKQIYAYLTIDNFLQRMTGNHVWIMNLEKRWADTRNKQNSVQHTKILQELTNTNSPRYRIRWRGRGKWTGDKAQIGDSRQRGGRHGRRRALELERMSVEKVMAMRHRTHWSTCDETCATPCRTWEGVSTDVSNRCNNL